MKNLRKLALILMVLISGALFSACGDKYENLEMSFKVGGKYANQVELVIDPNNEQVGSVKVGVEFNGINANDIGQVIVYSSPSELIVDKGDYTFDGNTCYVTIDASNVGDGELIAYHYASKKSTSIKLNIEKKSSNLFVKDFGEYVISIPDDGENLNSHTIMTESVLTLWPYGSSDNVYFQYAENQEINFKGITEIFNNGKLVGFNVTSEAEEQEINLYPVTSMKGYEDKPYPNKTFKLSFRKTLDIEDVKFQTADNAKDEKYDLSSTTYLVAKDDKYSTLKFYFKHINDTNYNFSKLYNVKAECSNKTVNAFVEGNNVIVKATTYTQSNVDVEVSFVPKNCIGDIKGVSKTINVKGELNAESVAVFKDGSSVEEDLSEKINIFDIYAGSTQGTLLKFKPKNTEGYNVFEDLRNIRIAINPDIWAGNTSANQKSLIDIFYPNGKRVGFEENTANEYLSEIITCGPDGVELYVKTKDGGNLEDIALQFDVLTVNTSKHAYLQGIGGARTTLKFTSVEGIKSVSSAAAYKSKEAEYKYIDESNDPENSIVSNLYLNIAENGIVDGKESENAKYIVPYKVQGYNDINQANITIEVKPNFQLKNKQNSLKLVQGKTIENAATELKYSYSDGYINIENSILLVFDENTELGDYTIVFKQEGSGFVSTANTGSIAVKVYKALTSDIMEETITVNEIIDNTDDRFAGYDDVDYIVRSNQNATITIELPEKVLNSNIVKAYKFEVLDGGDFNENDHLQKLNANDHENFAEFRFGKGSFVNGIKIVKLKLVVEVENYLNFATVDKTQNAKIEKEISFYVYEKVDYSNMELKVNSSERFMEELLGVKNKDDAVARFELKAKDNNVHLWNYVDGDTDNQVTWYKNSTIDESQKGAQANFTFTQQENEYVVTIRATISQFGNICEFSHDIFVKKPIISEAVRIDSPVKYLPNGQMQIDLKANEEYELKATNMSSQGQVDAPGVIIKVIDSSFTAMQQAVTITGNTLKVNKVEPGFKLIVFAKDALGVDVDAVLAGYDDPSLFLMDGYANAYKVINLQLSDGKTEDTAYSIYTKDDLLNIKESTYVDGDETKPLYYRIMNNINLYNTSTPISEFKGVLCTTYQMNGEDKVYDNFRLYNFKLNKTFKNLFTDFAGKMSNITFEVTYDYNNASGDLGVFDTNAGTLENVSVQYSGSAKTKNSANFGGLVGVNTGTIQYGSSVVGTNGNITLSSESSVYFGGLVGKNLGVISGYVETANTGESDDVTFVVSIEQEGYTANVNITALDLTADSAVGGLVGYNTNSIKDVKVSGTIKGTNNVGGVIGNNTMSAVTTDLKYEEGYIGSIAGGYKISNVRSSVVVSGVNNVGGIVGSDLYGTYTDCKYQIKPSISGEEKMVAVSGTNNVAGIAGYSHAGKFTYCSVMSYWWDYKNIQTTFVDKVADISGKNYVAGIVGYAESGDTTDDGNYAQNTIVVLSSVNAYVSGESNVAGLISLEEKGGTYVYNAYFIGKIDNGISNDLCIANTNNNIAYNFVYSLKFNAQDSEAIYGEKLEGTFSETYWHTDANLNGGTRYIVKKDGKPIFDVAPTSVSAELQKTLFNDVLFLEYYDFNNAVNNTLTLKNLIFTYNTEKLKDLYRFTCQPTGLGVVELRVVSSDPSKLKVNIDGTITINGIGRCTLEFVSALNPGVTTGKLNIYIDYPLGKFSINNGINNMSSSSIDNIPKGTSKIYFVETKGETTFGEEGAEKTYAYVTNTNPTLQVEIIQSTTSPDSIPGDKTVDDYLISSGTKQNVGVYVIKNASEFSLTAKDNLDNVTFTITVTPMISFEINSTNYLKAYPEVENVSFNAKLEQGVTNIALGYNSAVLYPNDVTQLQVVLDTDKQVEIFDYLKYVSVTVDGIETRYTKQEQEDFNEKFASAGVNFNKDNCRQINTYEMIVDGNITTKQTMEVKFVLKNNKLARVRYTILPQRIEEIALQNYTLKAPNVGEQFKIDELKNVLKPSTDNQANAGLMVWNMVPNNGYYDYLEVRDITGDQEIKFIQVKDENLSVVTTTPEITSDGVGIRLTKDYNGFDEKIYVLTQIDKDYDSKPHTIEIRAYVNGNATPIYTNEYTIEVRMLPSVTINEMLPNGLVGATVKDKESLDTHYIANGVDIDFRIDSKNVTEELVFEIDAESTAKENYELINTSDNFWTLRCVNPNGNVGKTIKLKVTGLSIADNGDEDKTEAILTFTITNFVVHGISVNNSHNAPGKQSDIYGNFDNPIDLEFYFGSTDISSQHNQDHNKVYRIDDLYDDNDSTLNAIYTIIKEINSNPRYLGLSKVTDKVDLSGRKIIVREKYNENGDVYLNLNVNLSNENNLWKINDSGTSGIEKQYKLNFTAASSMYEPQVIRDEDEFLAMADGDNYYILGKDLVLSNYVPLTKKIKEFDGNGHKITIKNFDFSKFENPTLQAGLFAEIDTGMIVKNLTVEYVSIEENVGHSFGDVNGDNIEFKDLCENKAVSYNSAQFGGLAAVNNGIITNCKVVGTVAFRASTVEGKKSENNGQFEIDFKIGGLVTTNGKTGYITNSTSELNIYSQSNIGGFVYENNGKIASSGVSEVKIFTYNPSLEKTIVVEIAGFVVENKGNIAMSFVEMLNENKTMSAKDTSAGFVYTNSSNIEDSYVVMKKTGVNNNIFSGFVYENNGTISTSYTMINEGLRGSANNYLFAPAGTQGITRSIEVVDFNKTSGYSNNVANLTSISYDDRSNRAVFEKIGFAFGDNESAVWTYTSGRSPQLAATLEKVEHTRDVGNATCFGLQNILEEKVFKDGGWVTTTKVNSSTYGTKANPYIIHDLATWDYYFANETTKYYRIVADIDFNGKKPTTSDDVFSGNIQGNKMKLSNYLLNSAETLESIGLFGKLVNVNDANINNSIRNLNLEAYSVWAAKTKAVGMLAGSLKNFNVYNIGLASKEIIVGGNAVGGLVGIAYGQFNIQKIDSAVSVNSSRIASSTMNVYSSVINKNYVSNLSDVYYAGSVVGVLDSYTNTTFNLDERNINFVDNVVQNYSNVRNIYVNGDITIIGDFAGAAFGFVGERVYLANVEVNLGQAKLAGYYYSAGLAAENRGVIEDASVAITGVDCFNGTDLYDVKSASGVVGLNIGGLVQNVKTSLEIIKTNSESMVGGIIAKNVNGVVNHASFDGKLMASYVGGIIGADYVEKDNKFFTGTLNSSCQNGLVSNQTKFKINGVDVTKNKELSISTNTVKYLLENMDKFYTYTRRNTFESSVDGRRVLGLAVGLSNATDNAFANYGFDLRYTKLIFNHTVADNETFNTPVAGSYFTTIDGNKLMSTDKDNSVLQLPYANVIQDKDGKLLSKDDDGRVFVTYIIGSNVQVMDVWSKSLYSKEMLIISSQEPEQNITVNDKTPFLIKLVDEDYDSQAVEDGEGLKGYNITTTYEYEITCAVENPTIKLKLQEMIVANPDDGKFIVNDVESSLSVTETKDNKITVKWTETKDGKEYNYTVDYIFSLTNS